MDSDEAKGGGYRGGVVGAVVASLASAVVRGRPSPSGRGVLVAGGGPPRPFPPAPPRRRQGPSPGSSATDQPLTLVWQRRRENVEIQTLGSGETYKGTPTRINRTLFDLPTPHKGSVQGPGRVGKDNVLALTTKP